MTEIASAYLCHTYPVGGDVRWHRHSRILATPVLAATPAGAVPRYSMEERAAAIASPLLVHLAAQIEGGSTPIWTVVALAGAIMLPVAILYAMLVIRSVARDRALNRHEPKPPISVGRHQLPPHQLPHQSPRESLPRQSPYQSPPHRSPRLSPHQSPPHQRPRHLPHQPPRQSRYQLPCQSLPRQIRTNPRRASRRNSPRPTSPRASRRTHPRHTGPRRTCPRTNPRPTSPRASRGTGRRTSPRTTRPPCQSPYQSPHHQSPRQSPYQSPHHQSPRQSPYQSPRQWRYRSPHQSPPHRPPGHPPRRSNASTCHRRGTRLRLLSQPRRPAIRAPTGRRRRCGAPRIQRRSHHPARRPIRCPGPCRLKSRRLRRQCRRLRSSRRTRAG